MCVHVCVLSRRKSELVEPHWSLALLLGSAHVMYTHLHWPQHAGGLAWAEWEGNINLWRESSVGRDLARRGSIVVLQIFLLNQEVWFLDTISNLFYVVSFIQ